MQLVCLYSQSTQAQVMFIGHSYRLVAKQKRIQWYEVSDGKVKCLQPLHCWC